MKHFLEIYWQEILKNVKHLNSDVELSLTYDVSFLEGFAPPFPQIFLPLIEGTLSALFTPFFERLVSIIIGTTDSRTR